MKKVAWLVFLTLVLLASLLMSSVSPASAAGLYNNHLPSGAVYTMTNAPDGNEVVVFMREADGTLNLVDTVSTNGDGSGGGVDPLASQGSLVLSDNGKWLLAVNAGSDELTVFRVTPGGLQFADKVDSGGVMPVSVTISNNLVYVLNAGGDPNISGFFLGFNGNLSPIPNSTRDLGAGGYSQVGFDNFGRNLVVINRDGNEIFVYAMQWAVPAASPVVSPSSGDTPFGLFFDKKDVMLVVEVNGGNGAVSSYRIKPDGTLYTISASVLNGQVAACWITGTSKGYIYTTNPGSTSISYYRESNQGSVYLRDATEATGIVTLDEDVSNDGRYLYALDPDLGGVQMYRIAFNGDLIHLGFADASLAGYAQGLAAR